MLTDNKQKFGWVKGVYIPSILTIFGAVMFLRMGWMLGQVGLVSSLIIVTLSSLITFLTALSIASTATNMKIEGGGAYFMISRSFGLEAGAAVGIPLFFAQSLGIAFYITGFAESVIMLFPFIPELPLKLLFLGLTGFTAYKSTDFALRTQGIILVLIAISIASFFLGQDTSYSSSLDTLIQPKASFWAVFAVFFPAVTGIEAGLSMSGDLKNASKALPIGTLLAVITGFIVYALFVIKLDSLDLTNDVLLSDSLIIKTVALIPLFVILGLWGSTLSSALGAMLGAPRTLQALAKDRVVFSFFAKGSDEKDIPQRATFFSLLVAACVFFLGDLNAIASILSMFFLTSYGFLNLSAAFEQLMGNPSWRPEFKTHFLTSLFGAIGCLAAMLMINAGATFIAIACVASIYIITKKRNLGSHWSDIRRGLWMSVVRNAIYRLDGMEPDARSWRPNIYALTGSPKSRWSLVQFANMLTKDKGFLSLGASITGDKFTDDRSVQLEKSIKDFLNKKHISALVSVTIGENTWKSIKNSIFSYGMGPIRPNTILFGDCDKDENLPDYISLIQSCYRKEKNVLILKNRNDDEKEELELSQHLSLKRIDIWWGREQQNANLMLALAHLMQQFSPQGKTNIFLKTTTREGEDQEQALEVLKQFVKSGRLNITPEVFICEKNQNPFEVIQQNSNGADLVFLGMRSPQAEESVDSYIDYYTSLRKKTEKLPLTCITLASEDINFKEIFN
ncbi:MAG TPA: Na-K-Cl cotransporter [Oligoflexia bacterium]|nr:Na-K-Cl cotransporter [Oligoflexia bacterium]HMR23848.1 Na-K-Cl cotransporter [Oligoflexia bacterium]